MEGPYEKRLLRVLEHIHADPAGDMSLDALSEVAALSRFHFHRVFHAMTGETLAEAVRRIRLDRAARWLVGDDAALDCVAARAGYPNPRSFARAFRAAYGMTPAAFRKRGAEGPPLHLKRKGHPMSFDVAIRTEPPRHCAALPHRGAYMGIGQTFERLGGIVAARGLAPKITGMIGVYYDDPSATPEAELRSHAGVALAPGAEVPDGLDAVDLTGGRAAVLTFRGHYTGLPAAYDWLYGEWLPASGEEPRHAPVVEIYLNTPMDTAPEELLTELCLPLK